MALHNARFLSAKLRILSWNGTWSGSLMQSMQIAARAKVLKVLLASESGRLVFSASQCAFHYVRWINVAVLTR